MKRIVVSLLLAFSSVAYADSGDLIDNAGPVMQSPTVFLIFWLPAGHHFEADAAGDSRYEMLLGRFFTDISGSSHLNIAKQYPGTCGPPTTPATQDCLSRVTLGGTTVDTTTYPHAGTNADPLTDADIQAAVTRFITSRSITPGLNTEFFVFTASGIQECDGVDCTFNAFCAYHNSFDTGGNHVVYAFMPQADSLGDGCSEEVHTAPNDMAADREIVAMSHEFVESLTDPIAIADTAWRAVNDGEEIGDICVPFEEGLGAVGSDGSNLHANGHAYVVQQEWSNNDAACVLSDPNITGSTIEFTVNTGGDDLRGDSSVSTELESLDRTPFQTHTLKPQNQTGWDNGSTHVRVFGFTGAGATALGNAATTLTSHPSSTEGPDNWDIDRMDIKVRSANGTLSCEQTSSGSPLSRLSGSAPTEVLPTPSCSPPPSGGVTAVTITIQTGHDDARSDTELQATFSGEPPLCLKPSNNAEADGVCQNGGSAHDLNGHQSWDNWTSSTQRFNLATPEPLSSLTSLSIQLLEHNSGFETDDNWDIQAITVIAHSGSTNTTLLNVTNPRDSHHDDNCMVRLSGSHGRFTFHLSATNPGGANPGIPPGSCPQ